MAKEPKQKIKSIGVEEEVQPEVEETIEAGFELAEIKMDKKCKWSIKFSLRKSLELSFRKYTLLMFFNETPHLDKIASKKRELQAYEDEQENKLPGMVDDKQTKIFKKQIDELEAEMEKWAGLCVDIEFAGEVASVNYDAGVTALVVNIPDTIIELLNKQKHYLDRYRVEMKPNI